MPKNPTSRRREKMLRVLSTLGVDLDVRSPYDKDR